MQRASLLAVFFLLCQSRGTSQIVPVTLATLNAGGGSTTVTPNFIVDWSIGESTLIDTYYGENADSSTVRSWSVTSGILQPFDKTHMLFNPQVPTWTDQEIRIYPVPTHGIIFTEIRSAAIGKISIQLFSNDGKLLDIREFNLDNGNSIQKWNLTNRPAGVYHFQILLLDENGNLLKQGTFNIDKL